MTTEPKCAKCGQHPSHSRHTPCPNSQRCNCHPFEPPKETALCTSRYTCGPECCGEEMWACELALNHEGKHFNAMAWSDPPATAEPAKVEMCMEPCGMPLPCPAHVQGLNGCGVPSCTRDSHQKIATPEPARAGIDVEAVVGQLMTDICDTEPADPDAETTILIHQDKLHGLIADAISRYWPASKIDGGK